MEQPLESRKAPHPAQWRFEHVPRLVTGTNSNVTAKRIAFKAKK